MKMAYFLLVTVFVLALSGCEKESNDIDTPDPIKIWKVIPKAIPNDKEITITFSTYYEGERYIEYVDPDYMELFFSETKTSGYKLIEKIIREDKSGFTYSRTFENLVNEKEYYFYVVSHKEGYTSVVSDTIDCIPNSMIPVENLDTDEATYLYYKPIWKVKELVLGKWQLGSTSGGFTGETSKHEYIYYIFEDDALHIVDNEGKTISKKTISWKKIESFMFGWDSTVVIAFENGEILAFHGIFDGYLHLSDLCYDGYSYVLKRAE